MDLHQLECFVAVADERSFTRAAARLNVVQSGISAVIKSLERELGASLFERSPKRVELTDAGAALLPKARATLDAARAARDAVDEVRGGLRGSVRIGTMTSISVIDLPGLLGHFHKEHPDVSLQLIVAPSGSRGLIEALAGGSLDMALVSVPVRPPLIHLRELISAPLELVVPAGHPIAAYPVVGLADLANEPFVDFPVGYGNRAVVDRAFAAAGLQRHISLEVTDVATAAEYVRHGLGVAMLPRLFIPSHSDLHTLIVEDADTTWRVFLARSATRPPSVAAQVLLRLLDDYIPELRPIADPPTAWPLRSY